MGTSARFLAAYVNGSLWARSDSLGADSTEATLLPAAPLAIDAGGVVPFELRVVPQPAPTAMAFRIGIDAAGIGVVQPGSALLTVRVSPETGSAFPFWTETGSFTRQAWPRAGPISRIRSRPAARPPPSSITWPPPRRSRSASGRPTATESPRSSTVPHAGRVFTRTIGCDEVRDVRVVGVHAHADERTRAADERFDGSPKVPMSSTGLGPPPGRRAPRRRLVPDQADDGRGRAGRSGPWRQGPPT